MDNKAAETDLDPARSEALRKIGRNVVNFQKMEAMLKELLLFGKVEGYGSELKQIVEQRASQLAKQTMAKLADALVKSALPKGESPDPRGPDDLAEPWFSFSCEILSSEEFIKERRRELKTVVEQRNKLIHQMLADFNPNSMESCLKLSSELDQQHDTIMPEYEFLKSMVEALRSAQCEMIRQLASGELAEAGDDKKASV